jgi:Leucine-rich repeat (LRR) protein
VFDNTVTTLNLTGLTQSDDLSVLKNCRNLVTLKILHSDIQAKNLDFLSNRAELRELQMPGCSIEDISVLKNCAKLKTLDLSGNNIADLAPLSSLNLLYIFIGYNKITDITPLLSMSNVKHVGSIISEETEQPWFPATPNHNNITIDQLNALSQKMGYSAEYTAGLSK